MSVQVEVSLEHRLSVRECTSGPGLVARDIFFRTDHMVSEGLAPTSLEIVYAHLIPIEGITLIVAVARWNFRRNPNDGCLNGVRVDRLSKLRVKRFYVSISNLRRRVELSSPEALTACMMEHFCVPNSSENPQDPCGALCDSCTRPTTSSARISRRPIS